MALTSKQKAFCEEYVQTYNARKSYAKVYGTSIDSAGPLSCNLLKRQEVRDYITELEKDTYELMRINAEHIANELSKFAFGELDEKYNTPANKLKALEMLQKQLGLQTQNLKADVEGNIEIKVDIIDE